ncbi:S-layer homology domain-containing protein [Citricoccus parietis]|uniref:S-layer homology domain-containing protein n=1 Tax=Citricoccus parietis TaxID=592307 RepID=A0ABV5G0E9_9MICC
MGQIAGRDVNVASIAVNDLLGSATVTRTVTATETGTWVAEGSVPGYEVTASPSTLSLTAGESATVEITLTRTNAPAEEWSQGSFTWARPGATDVTSPVAVRAVDVAAPEIITGEGSSGSADAEITPGVTGTLDPTIDGLGPATVEEFAKIPGGLFGGEDDSNHLMETVVPEGATSVTWSLNAGDTASDWDLFVVTPDGGVIQEATGSGSEQLVLADPAPGTYYAISNLYSSPESAEVPASMEAVVLAGDAGNLTVSPDPLVVETGQPTPVSLEWSGLAPGTWKGTVEWAAGTRTAVTVTVAEGEGPTDPTDPTECEAADFSDNTSGSPYYEPVRWMQCSGISVGRGDGSYGKSENLTRGAAMEFLYRYVDPEKESKPAKFSDVGKDHPNYDAISWASAQRIVGGHKDGTFRPSGSVTRGELATFLYRALGPNSVKGARSGYSDVPPSHRHAKAIAWLTMEGIAVGHTDGTFRPDRAVTRGESAAWLYRTHGVVTAE